jgi:hypothetical protein
VDVHRSPVKKTLVHLWPMRLLNPRCVQLVIFRTAMFIREAYLTCTIYTRCTRETIAVNTFHVLRARDDLVASSIAHTPSAVSFLNIFRAGGPTLLPLSTFNTGGAGCLFKSIPL